MFPVIAWYDIILRITAVINLMLLFPVIAWYDIIGYFDEVIGTWLLFPVIAWYDIISEKCRGCEDCCCSRLSLGMI